MTATTAVVVLLTTPLSLRHLSPLYFVPLLTLLVLLIERELIRSSGGARARAATRLLTLLTLPLLVAFLLLVALRLDYIFESS